MISIILWALFFIAMLIVWPAFRWFVFTVGCIGALVTMPLWLPLLIGGAA